jgi:hypothetical protein
LKLIWNSLAKSWFVNIFVPNHSKPIFSKNHQYFGKSLPNNIAGSPIPPLKLSQNHHLYHELYDANKTHKEAEVSLQS